MKYALVLRKLFYNNTTYYQAIDKVIGEETFDNRIKVIEGSKYLDRELGGIEEKGNRFVYLEIDEEAYNNFDIEYLFYKDEGEQIVIVNDPNEYNQVILAFHEEYHDFKIIPEYNIEDLVEDIKYDLKDKLLGQDKPIDKILRKIYDNYMYY